MSMITPAQQREAAAPWAEPGGELDAEALRRALERGLPCCSGGSLRIERLAVVGVRRSSSRRRDPHPITLQLDAHFSDAQRRPLGVQRLYAKAYRNGASAEALPAERARALDVPAFGDALARVGELDLLVWAWPNDPGLPQLPALLDPGRAAAHLPADPLHGAPLVSSCEVLRYRPEQRATLRYELRRHRGDRVQTLIGKTFADARAAQLHACFGHFWHAAAEDADAALVAEPLGVDLATRTLWQRAAQGVPLLERCHREPAPGDFAALGRALARLHAAPLAPADRRPRAYWLAEIDGRRRKIARALPALSGRVQSLAETLQRAAERLPEREPTLIHGDFHPAQVWVAGPRVVLFDFDEFALGDPMEDLAEFGTKLEQAPLPPARCRALLLSLQAAYRAAAPARWCEASLAWHRAVRSLVQASRAFVLQPPGWPQQLLERLARAEALSQEIPA